MNYRHSYHAGNFADVFKHVILIALTQSFLLKETPFCYLDTHAGAGCYDLSSKEAKKSKEFEDGILKIKKANNPPALIQEYLNFFSGNLYPGSPFFVKRFLREKDRMILCELHSEEHASLRQNLGHNKQINIHLLDGYLGLKAFLPPIERRGFVLIDPPYEKPDEFTTLANAAIQSVTRWETGTFAIWYPIKDLRAVERFKERLKRMIQRPQLELELNIKPSVPMVLTGCGMIIINPPWQLEEKVKPVLSWVKTILGQ